jgi:hypothetical protein
MDSKRKVEIFSGGCAFYYEVIDIVTSACRAIQHSIGSGSRDRRQMASCCTGKGVDIQFLKSEMGKIL